jgi:hypothetical protein
MTFLRFTTAFFLCTLCLWGCKKYDQNGSLLHLRTPEGRLIGNWQSAEVTQVGTADTNLTDFMASSNLLLDATFSEDQSVVIVNVNEDITYEGIWAFNEDKSVLHLDELTFDEVSGPFYLDEDSVDRADLVQMAYDFLQGQADCSDTLFLATGTYTVMTDEVRACVSSLMATGSNWVLSSGTLNYNGAVLQSGDVINEAMSEYIEGFVDDELLDESCSEDLTSDCIAEIVDLTLMDYGANVEFITINEPVISGWDDPGLIAALNENCGLDVVRYDGMPTGPEDPAVLSLLADNDALDLDCDGTDEVLGFDVTVSYTTDVKELDLYWEILELELDDLQAYQFREFNGESIFDFNFLLRFEKQN